MYRMWHRLPIYLIFTVLLTSLYILHNINLRTYKNIKNANLPLNANLIFPHEDYMHVPSSKVKSFKEILVHLDLKGAPPKVSFLVKFIPFLRKLGATGLLMEYEDMFPYQGDIEDIKALNAYTLSDISEINKVAERNNLTIIPLVQTFGHLEFVLKLEKYKSLREVDKNPQVLCPNNRNVTRIIREMISQVMDAHPSSMYLHMGCDEVNVIGICPKCRRLAKRNKWRKDDFYFLHVKRIAGYIREKKPWVRPIIWGDQFTKKNEKLILLHDLPQMIDVMFWNYRSIPEYYPKTIDMFSYVRLFKTVWVASSFKGSSGKSKIVTNPIDHLNNNEGWVHFAGQWKDKVNFKGIAVTGWQRYNHFSVLCELLPVAIPSLALSLQALKENRGLDFNGLEQSLRCNDIPPTNAEDAKNLKLLTTLKCDFIGFDIYQLMHLLNIKLEESRKALKIFERENFWIYNVFNNFSNPYSLKDTINVNEFRTHLEGLNELERKLRLALTEVYDENTINEWMMTHVLPVQLRLEAAQVIVQDLLAQDSWSNRPFTNREKSIRDFFNQICGPFEKRGCSFLNIF